ncbi:MAG: metallophosphoesterase, partial [Erysipelotrichaceae bacterium]|nr:metallophosphoesterase [Erysipelotrichaceae bacterium]
ISDQEDSVLYSPMAKDFLKNTDFIISAGDLHPEYLEFIVTMSNRPLFYVHGNHDDIYETKPPGGCTCIDDDLVVYQGIRILGLGGSFRYSEAKNQYTELQMERRIKKLKKKIRKAGGVDIVVTHAPIKGYGDLPDYAHQGFECFRKLLDDLKPRFWFYGHVHMNYMYNMPRVYTHKNTMIINVSGRYEIKY